MGDEIIIALVGGAVGAIITYVIAPWVNWAVEKKKLQRQYRAELIRQWREVILKDDFSYKHFVNHSLYGSLRDHLSKEAIEMMEAGPHVLHVGLGGLDPARSLLTKEIAKIEKTWELK